MNIRREWQTLRRSLQTLDAQTVCVLLLCILLVVVQSSLGSRRFFLSTVMPDAWQGDRQLLSWGWWFAVQGITGFMVPVILLRLVFRKSWYAMGLGLGDWRLAGFLALLYLPLVLVGTWVLSDGANFQAEYPHYRNAVQHWRLFILYHVLFLLYWVGWEYLWRGFVLFGTAHTLGPYAIFVQAIPFALLHLQKPLPEMLLSVVGGVAIGALAWRCRSFWIAVPIHAFQMLFLDLWCVLRIRTGVQGIGPSAFWALLTG